MDSLDTKNPMTVLIIILKGVGVKRIGVKRVEVKGQGLRS
jgi:hypothetical protein